MDPGMHYTAEFTSNGNKRSMFVRGRHKQGIKRGFEMGFESVRITNEHSGQSIAMKTHETSPEHVWKLLGPVEPTTQTEKEPSGAGGAHVGSPNQLLMREIKHLQERVEHQGLPWIEPRVEWRAGNITVITWDHNDTTLSARIDEFEPDVRFELLKIINGRNEGTVGRASSIELGSVWYREWLIRSNQASHEIRDHSAYSTIRDALHELADDDPTLPALLETIQAKIKAAEATA